jgi:hypothetical protein
LFRRLLAQKVKFRFPKLEIFAQRDRERGWLFDDSWFFDRPGEPIRDNEQHDRAGNKSHPLNETG